MKKLLTLCALVLAFGCKKHEEAPPPPPPEPVTTTAAATPKATVQPKPGMTLAAGAPIPGSGVLLWLRADDAQPGNLTSWSNPLVPGVTATAVHNDKPPVVTANALNGHAVVTFDGTDQQLMSSIDLRPAAMPDGTVISVFRSRTADPAPLRKLYGDDNGGYDRAVGLDNRGSGKNFTLFTGGGVAGYFQAEAEKTYVLVDQYSPAEFSGWVNGVSALANEKCSWDPEQALPNMYLGGSGTSYEEFWKGDLAEIIVYARHLTDAERMQVEDYLASKYGVTITRAAAPSAAPPSPTTTASNRAPG